MNDLTPPEVLKSQLDDLLRDLDADQAELACVAGLMARHDPLDPRVDATLARGSSSAIPWSDLAATLVDRLLRADATDDDHHAWSLLCGLDELSAGASLLGAAAAVAPAIDEVVRWTRAFPELWAPLAKDATALLTSAPPRDGDPAQRLWRAVEAARWADPPAPEEETDIPDDLRASLGLPVVISDAFRVRPAPVLAAASGLLPSLPNGRRLLALDSWEVVMEEASDGEPWLIANHLGATFECDGSQVAPEVDPEDHAARRVRARPGTWVISADGESVTFTLQG